MKIKIESNEIEILKHTLCETKLGIAGYVEAQLLDGRHVHFAGRWDNPYKAIDECAYIAEHIWIDGEYFFSEDENSYNFLSTTDDCLTAEDIAFEICKQTI